MFNDAAAELANLVDGAQSLSLTRRGVEHEFILKRYNEYTATYRCEKLRMMVMARVGYPQTSPTLNWFASFDMINHHAPVVSTIMYTYCHGDNDGLLTSPPDEALSRLQRRIDCIREAAAALP